jgi:hypothetical protein
LGFMGLVLLLTPFLPAHPERQPEPAK